MVAAALLSARVSLRAELQHGAVLIDGDGFDGDLVAARFAERSGSADAQPHFPHAPLGPLLRTVAFVFVSDTRNFHAPTTTSTRFVTRISQVPSLQAPAPVPSAALGSGSGGAHLGAVR